MKLLNVEIYEGNNPSGMADIQVNKVLDTTTGQHQTRIEVGETVIYLNGNDQQELAYMIANAE